MVWLICQLVFLQQTTCSINLEKYDKLETGLKFLKMRGKLGFFSSSLTMADLRFSVTIASSRNVLTMSTNTGARTLMLSFNILVFIGSNSQDFVTVLLMIFIRLGWLVGVKLVNLSLVK